jgi:hypothetical protein
MSSRTGRFLQKPIRKEDTINEILDSIQLEKLMFKRLPNLEIKRGSTKPETFAAVGCQNSEMNTR